MFFGTAEFAVPSLELLVAAGHQVLAVVTQPDRPQGRGRRSAPSPVKLAAERLGLHLMQPPRVRSERFIRSVHEMAPQALALAAFGQIIPQALLDIPPLGPVNVHGSLLPKYRGAAPIQRALMAGETETGVTTMWMDATLDTGDILGARRLPILPGENAGELAARLAQAGADLLIETLDALASGTAIRQPQDSSKATLAPALTAQDGAICWTEPASQTVHRIQGVTPRPGAFAAIQGRRLKVWRAEGAQQETGGGPGEVIAIEKFGGVTVVSGNGTAVRLLEVQPESGRRMSAAEWARGARVRSGNRFAASS